MDNFKVIYKILRYFESRMDCAEFDRSQFTEARFGVSGERWTALLEMLVNEGYVDGMSIQRGADGHVMVSLAYPRITLKGLEYLQTNELMRKAADAAKGIPDDAGH
jgi:hypothetical protein